MVVELRTDRLRLRRWTPADRAPFASLNADAEVMRYFPSTLSRAESDQLVDRIEAGLAQRGWGLWAAELLAGGAFIGFIGIDDVPFQASFTPAVEVGWRLAREHWGNGYATEGACAALDHGFGTLGLERIVSFTACANLRSLAVMRRLGMNRSGEFDHPRVAHESGLRRHVLYGIDREDWGLRRATAGATR